MKITRVVFKGIKVTILKFFAQNFAIFVSDNHAKLLVVFRELLDLK